MLGALIEQGSGALFWRAINFAKITREALRHHLEACFAARFPPEDTRQVAPGAWEFINKATQELRDVRAMCGDRYPPGAAPHPGEDGRLRVCIDIPGLNRAASQERF